MPEQIVGWLAQGGVLGGIAVLLGVIAWGIKTAGPELREWRMMLWARKDAQQSAALVQEVSGSDQIADAA